MFEKISLIIPTHNRHHYLTRVLDYYSDINLKILVADSSKSIYVQKDNFNIEYFHYPNYFFAKKMNDIVQKVKTPYICLCADDDFIIPSAIAKCLDFLEKKEDYSSVQGLYTKFASKNKNIRFQPIYLHIPDRIYDINGKRPEERMKQIMTLYHQLFYSVHRTNNLKQAFSLMEKVSDNINANLGEVLVALVSIINGKNRTLPFYYAAREVIYGSIGHTTMKLDQLINSKEGKEEYKSLISYLSKYLSEKYNYSSQDSRNYVIDAINCYFDDFIPYYRNRARSKVKRLEMIKKKILTTLEIISPKLFNIIKYKTIYTLFGNPSSDFYEDFKKINKYVLLNSTGINASNQNTTPILMKVLDITKLLPCSFCRKIIYKFIQER